MHCDRDKLRHDVIALRFSRSRNENHGEPSGNGRSRDVSGNKKGKEEGVENNRDEGMAIN